jgi:hypothetical protein
MIRFTVSIDSEIIEIQGALLFDGIVNITIGGTILEWLVILSCPVSEGVEGLHQRVVDDAKRAFYSAERQMDRAREERQQRDLRVRKGGLRIRRELERIAPGVIRWRFYN